MFGWARALNAKRAKSRSTPSKFSTKHPKKAEPRPVGVAVILEGLGCGSQVQSLALCKGWRLLHGEPWQDRRSRKPTRASNRSVKPEHD